MTPGSHTISAYADGQLIETRQFNTVQSGGSAFVTGISKTATISDFPSSGRTATLQWSQAKQSFVVTGLTDIGGGGTSGGGSNGGGGNNAVDLSSLQGSYSITANKFVTGDSCPSLGELSGVETFPATVTTSGNTVTIIIDAGGDSCTANLTYVSGNSTSGFNLSGSMLCSSSGSANMTATNLRKVNNQPKGSLTVSVPGCSWTDTF